MIHCIIYFVTDISTTEHNGPIHNRTFYVENMGTTQQTGPIDNRNVSAGKM